MYPLNAADELIALQKPESVTRGLQLAIYRAKKKRSRNETSNNTTNEPNMAISSDTKGAQAASIPSNALSTAGAACSSPSPSYDTPRTSISSGSKTLEDIDGTAEFTGDVDTNNDLPTLQTLKEIENLPILDAEGKSIPFKNLYTGPNVARRVLVIFIRHFFCGNCQEYIRHLSETITPQSLLSLPTPTFIAIVGHGSPALIPMYTSVTNTPFPIYADPTKKLYNALGMLRTLSMGPKQPHYMKKPVVSLIVNSAWQSLKQLRGGKLWKGGDYQQVGGEFLFEPTGGLQTPINTPGTTPVDEDVKQLGNGKGEQDMFENGKVEEKRVTWCHRMKNTRDHAEIPELLEVLGLEGAKDGEDKMVVERKGTGLSLGARSRTNTGLDQKLGDGKGVESTGEENQRVAV